MTRHFRVSTVLLVLGVACLLLPQALFVSGVFDGCDACRGGGLMIMLAGTPIAAMAAVVACLVLIARERNRLRALELALALGLLASWFYLFRNFDL